jgi:hypothetical protein
MDYVMGDEEVFYDADEDETLDNETASLPTTESIQTSSMMPASVRSSQVFDNDRLEKCGQWLSSIPRDDVIALRQTSEYEEFLQAFDRLGHAHRRVITTNRMMIDLDAAMFDDSGTEEELIETENHRTRSTSFSFLQHLAVDDVILRIFEFLECQILSRTSETCSRFRELAHRSAAQRTQYVANTRQLNNAMQLLRAKEQIDGVGYSLRYCHVRVPMLLLSRRILVTDAGDPEYNGVYFCTEVSGNGYVFTKPRFPEQRVMSMGTLLAALPPPPPPVGLPLIRDGGVDHPPQVIAIGPPHDSAMANDANGTHRGQLLKCVIAKRFSNERILWYMSKEVETISTETSVGEVTQVFNYWARLMSGGEATEAAREYPSQTSILSLNGDPAWQALPTGPDMEVPTVELLD